MRVDAGRGRWDTLPGRERADPVRQIAALPQGAIRGDKERLICGIGRTLEERPHSRRATSHASGRITGCSLLRTGTAGMCQPTAELVAELGAKRTDRGDAHAR